MREKKKEKRNNQAVGKNGEIDYMQCMRKNVSNAKTTLIVLIIKAS